ncbi:cobalamin biosynthesis protein CbiG [Caballeronia temeraria]|uniref:Cobalamin biosynthesis protein CbiG n=1 Tax=Caballeronia temeraria TaxID=1777137 RepID=A0A158AWS2_9BURK|nr:cobalamin biosynthesis protein [Caballeronia temeraria]SAK62304.1 cobalamin biosynthesis protein CbiG [Caballeronia temeraria]
MSVRMESVIDHMNQPAVMRLAVGIGCRRGTRAEAIEQAVRGALGALEWRDIAVIASIDVKRAEAGLLAFCECHGLPLRFYSADEIAQAPRTAISQHAVKHVNVDSACEPCALLAGNAQTLIVPKTIDCGVTVAIAMMHAPRADGT